LQEISLSVHRAAARTVLGQKYDNDRTGYSWRKRVARDLAPLIFHSLIGGAMRALWGYFPCQNSSANMPRIGLKVITIGLKLITFGPKVITFASNLITFAPKLMTVALVRVRNGPKWVGFPVT
jgi:hypothetical protein